MRLLRVENDGTLSWTRDLYDNIPPYAILSHRWMDDQEVTFEDLKSLESDQGANCKTKAGWDKINFCARQAKSDHLDHIWIDSCCINKANYTELSEAINSMFSWYKKAERCYIYLPDVIHDDVDTDLVSSRQWNTKFRSSEWFKRGWTLQELLAPQSAEFFSKEGTRLGDRQMLSQTISEITMIPVEALSGTPLSQFSVAERFSWAETRETTRKEDVAYCLFGLFDVHLPLIYGEGREKALDRLKSAVEQKENKGINVDKLRNWLSAPDPSINYNRALKQRQADTGQWLLQGGPYLRWKSSARSRLWLHGIPGCGKTILSSTIIEDLHKHIRNNPRIAVAYFYFDFRDIQKQDPELMLRSLLCQLLHNSIVIPKGVGALHASCADGQHRPSLEVLLQITEQIVQQFTQVYIILDALDECTQRTELLNILRRLAAFQPLNMHLLMTSRKERDIEMSLDTLIGGEDMVSLQRDVVDEDIQRYVRQRLSNDISLSKWEKDASVKKEIEEALVTGARGMFRWAVCQLDTLGKCRNRVMLRKALAKLPPTLDQTYEQILCSISETDREYALRILQWLAFSERPLCIEEVAEVVAIDVTRERAFDREEVLQDPLDVLIICSSLLVTTTISKKEAKRDYIYSTHIVALAHYSVQEYLVSDRIQQGLARHFSMREADCHATITKGCLGYLMQYTSPLSAMTLEEFALARYSAEFWPKRLQKTCEHMGEVNQLVIRLLSTDNPAYLAWLQLCDSDQYRSPPNFENTMDDVSPPLYYVSLLNLPSTAKILLEAGANANAQGGWYGTALQAASDSGLTEVVKILLKAGADVNAQGGECGNALQAASRTGSSEVVKILLEAGADVNAQGGFCRNALQAASWAGSTEIVKILLEAGADVNAQGGLHRNALQTASMVGSKEVVKILLEAGADVNAQGGWYGTALQAASASRSQGNSRLQVVEALIAAGADVNAQGGEYGSALRAATKEGNERIVELLLAAGAHPLAEEEKEIDSEEEVSD